MERTATHDTEYVDIVLGYHHVLLFSLVFGVMIFGTGYFIGYYRARSDRADSAASATTSPTPSSPATASSPAGELPPVQLPAMLTEPPPATGDVVKEMEAVSTRTLAPAIGTNANPAAASATPRESAPLPPAREASSQQAPAAPPLTPPSAKPAATPAAEPPKREGQAPANGNASPPAAKTVPRAAAKPPNAGGNIYLQVSSFGAQQEAEKLINDLATEGFRAMIDGQLVEGRHTVLVGPFSDFETAVGQAKVLKQHNREAFPIRR